ncbi:response regulator transcription factor [bacterium]|nr:response regulator transcription factor [bacterium]
MDQTISNFIKNKKALVVEDEAAIAQLLKINLTQLGFDVETSGDAETAFANLQNNKYDLCLLDWMLPGVQGVDFLKKIRPHHKALKVMMVTAKADADSVVMGLESGADDYLPKPFDAKVLAARVRQLMRRLQMEQELLNQLQPAAKPAVDSFPDPFEFDDLKIHFSKHIVQHMGADIHLTPSEFKLMEALIKAQGKVLTREQLIDLIQGEDVSVTGRTIDTHIFALRKKIGKWSKHIETIRGVGYRILISLSDTSEPEEVM